MKRVAIAMILQIWARPGLRLAPAYVVVRAGDVNRAGRENIERDVVVRPRNAHEAAGSDQGQFGAVALQRNRPLCAK